MKEYKCVNPEMLPLWAEYLPLLSRSTVDAIKDSPALNMHQPRDQPYGTVSKCKFNHLQPHRV